MASAVEKSQDDSATEAPQTEDEEPLVYEGEDEEEEENFYSPEARLNRFHTL